MFQVHVVVVLLVSGFMTTLWITGLILRNFSIVDPMWGAGLVLSNWVALALTADGSPARPIMPIAEELQMPPRGERLAPCQCLS